LLPELLLRRLIDALLPELLNVRLDFPFLIGELLRGFDRVVHVAARSTVLLLVEETSRFVQLVERLLGFSALLIAAARCRFAHGVRGVLETTSRVGE
jgi:hypothetical protein